MNDAISFMKNIQSSFNKMKFLTVGLLILTGTVVIASTAISFWYAREQREQIYVLDEGSVLSAFRTDNGAQRDLEVGDQFKRFLQLFFNIAPNATTIEKNISLALELADRSASDYYNDLKEQEYFTRIIENGISQSVDVDSVTVNIFSIPYQAEAHGNLYTVRSTNISRTPFVARCTLTESQRTKKNVHGLIIERFTIDFGETEVRARSH